jgi:hypothetical protein
MVRVVRRRVRGEGMSAVCSLYDEMNKVLPEASPE